MWAGYHAYPNHMLTIEQKLNIINLQSKLYNTSTNNKATIGNTVFCCRQWNNNGELHCYSS